MIAVGVGEIPGVAAPEYILGRLQHGGARLGDEGQQLGDLLPLAHVVREGDAGEPLAGLHVRADVGRQLVDRIESQQHAGRGLKPGNAVRLFCLGLETQAVPVKPERSRKVRDAERDDADAWFHGAAKLSPEIRETKPEFGRPPRPPAPALTRGWLAVSFAAIFTIPPT